MNFFLPVNFTVHGIFILSASSKFTAFPLQLHSDHTLTPGKSKTRFLQAHFSSVSGVQIFLYSWYFFTKESISMCFVVMLCNSQDQMLCYVHPSVLCLRKSLIRILLVCPISNHNAWFWPSFWTGISFKTNVGENSSVISDMAPAWNETTLPTLLTNYSY